MKSGKAALALPTSNEGTGKASRATVPAAAARAGRVMAQDPFSADDILAGFYRPDREARSAAVIDREARSAAVTAVSHPRPKHAGGHREIPAHEPPASGSPAGLNAGRVPEAPTMPKTALAAPAALAALAIDEDFVEASFVAPVDVDEETLMLTSSPSAPRADEANEANEANNRQSNPAKPAKPTHYKIVCISLYNEDIARLESMVSELKRRGHTKANKSQLIRYALEQVDLTKVPRSG